VKCFDVAYPQSVHANVNARFVLRGGPRGLLVMIAASIAFSQMVVHRCPVAELNHTCLKAIL
jgi:hypothetical protein